MKLPRQLFVILGLGVWAVSVMGQTPPNEEEEPEVVGIEVPRSDGSFLGVAVEGRAFVVRFYDEEKEEVPADFPRGSVRWRKVGRSGQEFLVMNQSGSLLRTVPRVNPPYIFIANINLMTADGDVAETYVVNLKQLNEPKETEAKASNY